MQVVFFIWQQNALFFYEYNCNKFIWFLRLKGHIYIDIFLTMINIFVCWRNYLQNFYWPDVFQKKCVKETLLNSIQSLYEQLFLARLFEVAIN